MNLPQTLIGLVAAAAMSGCFAALPHSTVRNSCTEIEVPAGPEDFAFVDANTLLVASTDRRDPDQPGALTLIHLPSKATTPVTRVGEPDGFQFSPHGIDIHAGETNTLYAIVHDHRTDPRSSAIAVYSLADTYASFVTLHSDPMLESPNDLIVDNKGHILTGNDPMLHPMQALFRMKSQNVVQYRDHAWSSVIEDLGFPNGLAIIGNELFVATTLEDKIYAYKLDNQGIPTSNRRLVARVPGPDNLMVAGNTLYTAGHIDMLKFVKHAKEADKIAPSVVYAINATASATDDYDNAKVLYANEGTQIAAASVAVAHANQLIIGQVFGSHLLSCRPQ